MRDRLKSIKRVVWAVMVSLTLLIGACIKNDIPYPYIELYITAVEGVGFTQKSLNYDTRTVTIELEEQTDIEAVEITNVTYSDEATLSREVVGTFDMRLPVTTTLYLYQSYDWQIVAEQNIERYFKATGQIGEEVIDLDKLTATLNVNETTTDLNNIEITSLKLGAEGITTYSPEISEITSFNSLRRITVTSHGRSEEWTLIVNQVEPSVELTVNPFATYVTLTATGDTSEPETCGFKYSEAGSDVWYDVLASKAESGVFSVDITGLNPESDYYFIAYAGESSSSQSEATTESTTQLPNGDFERWYIDDKVYYPYDITDSAWWGTGNKGAAIGGSSITTYDEEELPASTSGSRSTRMTSKNIVNIKFAAGNLFTGEFLGLDGVTNGILLFGRPFESRPTSLKGYVKYDMGVVDCNQLVNGEYKLEKGDDDIGHIYIALVTWDVATYGTYTDSTGAIVTKGTADSPHVVNTKYTSTFFDPTSSAVVAYGDKQFTASQDWDEFEIELNYLQTDTKPTHIIIVCTSSKYGDYFTGSSNSEMWVDDFVLTY